MLDGSPGLIDQEPLPGNFNGDTAVDRADIVRLLQNFGRAGDSHRARGDANGDRDTTLTDLALLQSGLGATHAAPSPAPLSHIVAVDADVIRPIPKRTIVVQRIGRESSVRRVVEAAVDTVLTDDSLTSSVRRVERASLRASRSHRRNIARLNQTPTGIDIN
jgi:hypothetical protein